MCDLKFIDPFQVWDFLECDIGMITSCYVSILKYNF